MNPATITLRDIGKTFGSVSGVRALQDISLDISPGSFVSIIGPSGCGKTTLLRLLNGLIRPDQGEILIGGDHPHPGPHMGLVFQSYRLLPWRAVRANVSYPLELRGMPAIECAARADHYLAMVGLGRFAASYPAQLSGGMQQRVALARALAGEPAYLLMDEPFASLDAPTREFIRIELMKLRQSLGSTVVFVTHSVDEAILLSDRVVLLSPRPGRIAEVLTVDLPHPRWDYDVRACPGFIELRGYLWARLKALVATDPQSEFFRPGQ